MDQTTPKVGTILSGTEGRDAIHFALAPTKATERLSPNQHVDKNGGTTGVYVGKVDPFLVADVMPGQWFYLFLYPNTITSLRHVWTHPEYVIKVPGKE